MSQSEGNVLFPPGCTVRKDIVLHSRWQVKASYLAESRSKVFSARTGLDADAALLFCLRCAWPRYLEVSGGECPWDLDGPLFEAGCGASSSG